MPYPSHAHTLNYPKTDMTMVWPLVLFQINELNFCGVSAPQKLNNKLDKMLSEVQY